MSLYKDIATPLAVRGVPTIPLRPKTKDAFLRDWQNIATTDPVQIEQWDNLFPDSNAGSVAKGQLGHVWFLELDDPALPYQIETETGHEIPKTFRVRSSPGKGHYYWKHTPSSLAMGNVPQNYVKNNNFSARIDNQYVVAPGSIHPKTGLPYEVVSEHEIVEAPEWLIEWIIKQKINAEPEKKIDLNVSSDERIPRGAHDNTLTAIAGKLRNAGIEKDAIENALIEVCEKRCDDYGSDYKQMCKKIAISVCRYPAGNPESNIPYLGSQRNLPPVPQTIVEANPSLDPGDEPEDQPTFIATSHPKFPDWVMLGTSLYENFVKPYCAVNSRYEEFMWFPAFALLLNYIGTKVNVHMKKIIPSVFMVIIGRRGETMKSASVQDAIQYFVHMGCMEHAGPGTKNAEGKSLVWTAGSPEGLGMDVQRTNCKNIVLMYDELSTLTNKAGIESSALVSTLLQLYESAKFSNKIKSGKESYSIDPGTYCTTLMACSTDRNFLKNWSKLSGDSTGLDDRFFFLYQPEQFKDPLPQIAVNTKDGAIKTRILIDQAVRQGVYKITDDSPLAHKMKTRSIDNRESIRVEKFALGFAIDLDKQEIDEECIERALALVKYEKEVKRFLAPFEASTLQGSIQMELITLLKKHNGSIRAREMNKLIHPERLGTDVWIRAYAGLKTMGYIAETGKGTKNDPQKVILMRAPEDDD